MPAPHPPEFRRRAIDLARQRGVSVAQVAKDLGISESGLRRWMSQDDVDAGRKEGLWSDERVATPRPDASATRSRSGSLQRRQP